MRNPRRDFLGWLGASTLLAATGSPLGARERGKASRSALEAINGDWDMSWIDRIQGKHRAVFDSPEMSEGKSMPRSRAR